MAMFPFGKMSGVFYQNDSPHAVSATICLRATGTSASRYSPTADPTDEVTVPANGLQCRTYQVDPGQGIVVNSDGNFVSVSLEVFELTSN